MRWMLRVRPSVPRPEDDFAASSSQGMSPALRALSRALTSPTTLLPSAASLPPDPGLRYIRELVAGHIARALGGGAADSENAAAAYRRALGAYPGAQSARVSLMTWQITHDQAGDAYALATALQTAGVDQGDPWWTYSRGDYRVYPAIVSRLRGLSR